MWETAFMIHLITLDRIERYVYKMNSILHTSNPLIREPTILKSFRCDATVWKYAFTSLLLWAQQGKRENMRQRPPLLASIKCNYWLQRNCSCREVIYTAVTLSCYQRHNRSGEDIDKLILFFLRRRNIKYQSSENTVKDHQFINGA